MVHAKFQKRLTSGFRVEFLKVLTIFMGMAAILVM